MAHPDGVRIGRSQVHGRGVFATRAFRRGELVGVYTGVVCSVESRRRKAAHPDPHFLYLNEAEEYGVAPDRGCRLRFLNSSHGSDARPNLRMRGLAFFATRAIKPGDELLFDYTWGHG